MDARKEKIRAWLDEQLPGHAHALTPASSDASFRRYFRIRHGRDSLIVMDAPPEREQTGPFCRIARQFRAIGLNVPEILAEDEQQGFVLMTDLGTRQYLDELDVSTVESLYRDALDALVVLQAGAARQPGFLPPYNRDKLIAEMDLFRDWYLPHHVGHEASAGETALMDRAWELLVASALEQPQVWVHRDFHSRNLMVTDDDNPGILDFQDAVTGPITYDLVSLLKDCYIEWPEQQIEDWVLAYHDRAVRAGLLDVADEERFLRWFHRMGIQRHLKVAGIFTRLHRRDGKDGYLADIPLTMRYLCRALADDPELAGLHDFIAGLDNGPCMQ